MGICGSSKKQHKSKFSKILIEEDEGDFEKESNGSQRGGGGSHIRMSPVSSKKNLAEPQK